MRSTRFVTVLVVTLFTLSLSAAAASAAPPANPGRPIVENAIWADGRLMGTILLGDLPFNDNPHAFDRLFQVPGQAAVAEAAPGRGYNGGRWLPVAVTWHTDPYLLTSYAEVAAAAAAGDVALGDPQYDAAFLCPLIPRR